MDSKLKISMAKQAYSTKVEEHSARPAFKCNQLN